MKRIIKVFLLVVGIFAFGGCNSNKAVTDVSSLVYLDSSNKENIAYNLSLVARELKGVKFDATVVVKDKQYKFNGEIIIKDSIENSVVHINYKDNNLYLKNGNVYLSYMYKNTNVIVKDSVENYIGEIVTLLENKGIKCNEEKINEAIKNKNLDDLNFYNIGDKIEKHDNGYVIEYKDTKTYLDNNYLPVVFEWSKNDLTIDVNFKYSPVSISVPVGYDLVDINIKEIKDLLRINSVSDLLK